MKIVIDIGERVYDWLKNGCSDEKDGEYAIWIILNGTPLPKGHGDLIDRTEVIKSLFDYHNGKKTIGQCVDDVTTIIEAESEEEE